MSELEVIKALLISIEQSCVKYEVKETIDNVLIAATACQLIDEVDATNLAKEFEL